MSVLKEDLYRDGFILQANKEILDGLGLSFHTRAVYFEIRCMAEYPNNAVYVKGVIPTMVELANRIGVSSKTLKKHLKIMEEHNLVKDIKKGCKHVIYINPMYYSSTYYIEKLDQYTLDIFGL